MKDGLAKCIIIFSAKPDFLTIMFKLSVQLMLSGYNPKPTNKIKTFPQNYESTPRTQRLNKLIGNKKDKLIGNC